MDPPFWKKSVWCKCIKEIPCSEASDFESEPKEIYLLSEALASGLPILNYSIYVEVTSAVFGSQGEGVGV